MRAFVKEGAKRIPVDVDEATLIGRGANANIHPVRTEPFRDSLAKLYREPDRMDRARIQAMIRAPPHRLTAKAAFRTFPQYAWPSHVLFLEAKKESAIGFLMPRVDERESLTLEYFYDPSLASDAHLAIEERALPFRLAIARNLASVLAELHSHEHCVVDFKPQNIKVYRGTGIVALLDCDSFRIRGTGKKIFSATNYTSEYIAPEALRHQTRPDQLGEDQDRFALAVVLFQLLNFGTHPFQGILLSDSDQATSNDDKVREGLYPHGLTPHARIKPRPMSTHDCLDVHTRSMFDLAFAGAPERRPTARVWSDHFARILDEKGLAKCDQAAHQGDPLHIRFAGRPCAACRRAKPVLPVLPAATGGWNERCQQLGARAPRLVLFPWKEPLRIPTDVCAWCGEHATGTFDLTRGLDDERVLLTLPACAPCANRARRWWMQRKLLGCGSLLVLAVGVFCGFNLFSDGAVAAGIALLLLAISGLVGQAYARGWIQRPAKSDLKRDPILDFAGGTARLYAAPGFLLALLEMNPRIEAMPDPRKS